MAEQTSEQAECPTCGPTTLEQHSLPTAVERILAARLAENTQYHLDMHRAYRPEVVAEIAVEVSEEMDWAAVAAWCGGRIETSEQGDSGEYGSSIVIPGCRDAAGVGSWITLDHAGRFRVRTEVMGPEHGLPPATATGDADA